MTPPAYKLCLEKIYKLGRFGIKLELDTISNILSQLKTPQNNYNMVHVAGTNGKGSTATCIAAILSAAGFKTGIYTSPHLVRFNERICVNGQQISDADVVSAYEAVNAADNGSRRATFFEIVTAMAFYHFAKETVEWAVIETGMGGRFDATNVITPNVSVITNLSIEHSDYLGHTIRDLAREKGGIIKPGVPAVTAVSQPSGMDKLTKISNDKGSALYLFKNDFFIRKIPDQPAYNYKGLYQKFKGLTKPLPGEHQRENLALALAAVELIFEQNKETDPRYELTQELIHKGLARVHWPGRLEKVMDHPLVILDGAHNLRASVLLGKYLKQTLGNKRLTLVIGILDDKPYEAMLAQLLPRAQRVIVTKAKIDRSIESAVLAAAVKKIFKGDLQVIEDVQDAVSYAILTSCKNDAICIAGSLYVAGEAKEKFDSLK
ncbi:bifunctional folylpolyglutamate synthase/dihydrofolate synthase [Desulfobacter hydrogenophilus]|uniref:Dihydrofolate synthase/folylpolyglutamate synthase n=1 Tax=Desulfobacter hydrogenophilus TaxID=2291 RepID=A0A328FC38_9BACT|nr:folylpolyglutamate synthase/dihydrofolate synthase family protein [Desulfobacter hydrogenophilus]NDY72194.1 bifunctional folylpolyglutamate synthase/dihydrofolate synthase [Desulfobacter hydrogenophilus]QBH15125.1 bifunctional folylpolyglutamate synthase/dihydrofolate synthase [Desulfobacter hydrogenophilus]RAM02201.1 bifunctional folylpolyglutamate synthase/dihydrofolate synthase [Desulfobacter hydrogenophilus]